MFHRKLTENSQAVTDMRSLLPIVCEEVHWGKGDVELSTNTKIN